MIKHLLLYIINKTSHLVTESVFVIIVIADVLTVFRCDECDTTFPHECRRSGLNDGTIRKWRLDDDDADGGDSWSIPPSNDMIIDFFVLFLLYIYIDESKHEKFENNQIRIASHVYTHVMMSLPDQLHFLVCVCREYKIESSYDSCVETGARE